MTNPITPSMPTLKSLMQPTASSNAAASSVNFESLLSNAIENTASLDRNAQDAIQTHLAGGDITSVEVFSGIKKADLALRMMLQVRNKLLEGFNEIKQMQM